MVFVVGLTVTTDPVIAPGFHVYVEAPFPVKVADDPAHITVGDADAETVGVGFTFKFNVAVRTHPAALAPVIVHITVAVGLTTTFVPVIAPGFQVYELAPVAVSVALLPGHKTVGLLTTVKVGLGFTVISIVFVPIQPPAFLPLSVYVVLAPGVKVTIAPVLGPGVHV